MREPIACKTRRTVHEKPPHCRLCAEASCKSVDDYSPVVCKGRSTFETSLGRKTRMSETELCRDIATDSDYLRQMVFSKVIRNLMDSSAHTTRENRCFRVVVTRPRRGSARSSVV